MVRCAAELAYCGITNTIDQRTVTHAVDKGAR
ncbi:MAG: hypothetical protein ACK2U0_19890 [Candidatus Promineifilaceae bacterium]